MSAASFNVFVSANDPKGTTMSEQTTMERLYAQIETGDDTFAVRLYSEGQSLTWQQDSTRQSLRRYAESVQRVAAEAVTFADGERSLLDTLGSYAASYDEAVNKIKALDERVNAWEYLAASYLDR